MLSSEVQNADTAAAKAEATATPPAGVTQPGQGQPVCFVQLDPQAYIELQRSCSRLKSNSSKDPPA